MYISSILVLLYKPHNAPVQYPTMHHFVQKCAHVNKFLLQIGVLWDMGLVHCGIHVKGLLNEYVSVYANKHKTKTISSGWRHMRVLYLNGNSTDEKRRLADDKKTIKDLLILPGYVIHLVPCYSELQPLFGLLLWYPLMTSSLCTSFKDWAPRAEFYGCPIWNWVVAVTWLKDRTTRWWTSNDH